MAEDPENPANVPSSTAEAPVGAGAVAELSPESEPGSLRGDELRSAAPPKPSSRADLQAVTGMDELTPTSMPGSRKNKPPLPRRRSLTPGAGSIPPSAGDSVPPPGESARALDRLSSIPPPDGIAPLVPAAGSVPPAPPGGSVPPPPPGGSVPPPPPGGSVPPPPPASEPPPAEADSASIDIPVDLAPPSDAPPPSSFVRRPSSIPPSRMIKIEAPKALAAPPPPADLDPGVRAGVEEEDEPDPPTPRREQLAEVVGAATATETETETEEEDDEGDGPPTPPRRSATEIPSVVEEVVDEVPPETQASPGEGVPVDDVDLDEVVIEYGTPPKSVRPQQQLPSIIVADDAPAAILPAEPSIIINDADPGGVVAPPPTSSPSIELGVASMPPSTIGAPAEGSDADDAPPDSEDDVVSRDSVEFVDALEPVVTAPAPPPRPSQRAAADPDAPPVEVSRPPPPPSQRHETGASEQDSTPRAELPPLGGPEADIPVVEGAPVDAARAEEIDATALESVPESAPGAEVDVAPPAPPRKRRPPPPPPPAPDKLTGSLEDKAESKRKRPRLWWEELFTDDFARAIPPLNDRQVKRECQFIADSLAVSPGGVLLDLACGTGRHAVEMASRGYSVVGYDLSVSELATAAEHAQERDQKINFLQGDMREMAFDAMFDAIYCWNSSFGYFEEEKNLNVIERVFQALKPGGAFLLDVPNRDFVATQAPTSNWFEGDGAVCMDDMTLDFITSRIKCKRTLMLDDGRNRECNYSIRVYSLHELGRMLHDVGFRISEASGHPSIPGVFFGATSPRLLVLALKP